MAKPEKPEIKKKKKEDWPSFIEGVITSHPAVQYKHPMMALCKNFYKGEQYKWISKTSNRVIDVRTTRETRCIYNFIRVFTNTWAAKMIAGNPFPQAQPHLHNTERFDRDVCRVSNALLASWWRRENVRNKLGKLVRWAGKVGLGVWRLYYCTDEKRKLRPDSSLLEKYGIKEETEIPYGKIELDVVNPMHYLPDPVAREDEDRRYAIAQYPVARSIAEEVFDIKFEADDKNELESAVETTTESADGYEIADNTEDSDIVIVKELEMMPCRTYPRGKHVIVINKHVVVDEDAVDEGEDPADYELSYYTYRVNREDDEYYGMGYVQPLLTPQRDANKAQSMIMENMTATGVNKVIVTADSGIGEDGYSDDPWDKITVNATAGERWQDKIGALPANPYPQYIVDAPDSILQKALLLVNLNMMDFSRLPQGGSQMPGVVMEELKEASRIAFSEDINDLKGLLGAICMRYLKLVQTNLREDEIIEIVGKNYEPHVKKFMEARISPDAVDIDVRIGLGFEESASARVEKVTALVQAGVFSPLEAKWAMRNYGNVDKLLEDTFLDEEQAERNLDRIISGEDMHLITVSQFANHDAHIKVFVNFIKTPQYETLEFEKKRAVDDYIANMFDHKSKLMAMQQGPPQMAGGGGGAMGGPPPQQQPPQPPNPMAQSNAEANLHMSPGRPPEMPISMQGV